MSLVYSHALKYSEGEVRRNQEMDSNNIGYPQQHCHQQNSGLLRYNSAPSSLLKSLTDEEPFRSEDHNQNYPPSTSSDMESMLAKLISSNSEPLHEVGDNPVKQEINPVSKHNGYSYVSPSQITYQPQQTQGLPNGSLGASGNSFDGSLSAVRALAPENYTQNKGGSSNFSSNLIRQKSSPAGFFSNYSVDNGLAALREVGSFGASAVPNGHATTSSSGLHGTFNFSSRTSSCSTRMPQIAETEHEDLQANCVERRNIGSDTSNTISYMPSYLWDGSAFNASKTATNNSEFMFGTTNLMETMV